MAIRPELDPIDIVQKVARALDGVGAPYFVTGSIASSLMGEYRYTNDIDVVTELANEHVSQLQALLSPEFYFSEEAARSAVERRGSFNVIHMESVIKVDLFVSARLPYDTQRMSRRRPLEVRPGVELFFLSPEDIILSKLQWYVKGGRVSDSQWKDVLGVLRVQNKTLDVGYLHHWAENLQLENDLQRALNDAEA